MLFDTHAHLNSSRYKKKDLEMLVTRALENGVCKIVVNGYDIKSSVKAVEIASMFSNVYATVGIHPLDIECFNDDSIRILKDLAKHHKVVAIGEIGIDLHYDKNFKDKQVDIFKKQLSLAEELNLPVTIHSREALNLTYEILKEFSCSGIMHCYSGSLEYAKKFVDIGYYISLAGPVTFKNARQAKEVATNIDINKLLVETDCPYLAPHPFRGKINEPSYVTYVAKEIASLRNMDYDLFCEITFNNACEVYKIEKRDCCENT